MFDKFINWLKGYPRLRVFLLTLLFFGLVFGWIIMMAPFYIHDAWRDNLGRYIPLYVYHRFREDFRDYFDGIETIWKSRKEAT